DTNPSLLYKPSQELLGKTLHEVFPKDQADFFLHHLRQVIDTQESVSFEYSIPIGDTKMWFYATVSPLPEHKTLMVARDITDQKEAQAQVLASEQLFRALVENSPDFIARYDREFRRIYVNPAIQKLFGDQVENVLGKTPADQSPVYAPQIYINHLRQVIETGTESVTEMPFLTAKGEMHWGHMRFVPEFGPEGRVESVLAIGRDIHEIKENERRFRMLAENFPDFVMRFDSEGRYIYVNPAFEKAVGMPAESIIGKTLQELPQRIKTEQNRARLDSIRRALDEGISNESEVRWDTEKGERIFEDRYVPERDATGNVVTVLCIARDVTEQKRAEEELQKTNDLLRAIIEAAPTAIIGLDLEGKVQNVWNPAAEKMLGWSAEEALGKFLPSVSVDKEEEFQKFRQWVRSGKSMNGVEVQRRRRDGTPIDYSIYASPLHDTQGQTIGNIAVLVDITERKRVEQALRESEERYRLIAENTADTIAVFDLNLRPTYISPSIIKLRGYSVQEALAQSLDQMLTPESLQQAQKVLADQMALEASGEANLSRTSLFELEEYCKDGSVIWVELAASFLRDENSQPTGVLTVTRDITERKRAEDDLRASETRFRTLVDHAADAFFLYDEQGTILDVNRQACESLGYSRHELIGMTPYEIDSMLDHSFIGQLESRLDAGDTVAFETRHRRKDGSVFPVEVRGRPFWHGERRFSVALARDITERKQAEEQRKEHVRFLESMDKVNRAMQSANDIEWVMNDVLDLVLSIFDCDRAYLGYPCDPETPSWSLRAESTRPEYPGLLALGIDEVPIDPEGTEIFRILLNTDGPVTFGPGNSHPLSANATNRFGLQSFMSMAFFPKVGKPWQFGIHQCSYTRVWTPEDERLFHEIGRRLSDVLTVLLTYHHLEESEERYRQLVNLSPDGISIHRDGRVQFVNPAMVRMSGATSADQLIGKSVLDGIHPDFRAAARNRMHEMESSGQPLPFIEEKLLRLDGSSIDVELAAVPYNINNTRYILIVARDITERKRAEEALRESEERLRQI
ncbi:MAG TPA: PAS domain S-box protein, partial [Anaerolineales bacterium]|nr:PAS domain S-box protein [Anaerolineales bacterium]